MDGHGEVGCLVGGYFFISFMVLCAPIAIHISEGTFSEMYDALFIFSVVTLVFMILIFVYVCRKLTNTENKLKDTSKRLIDEQSKSSHLSFLNEGYKKKIKGLDDLLQSTSPFSYVAKMYATAHAFIFREDIGLMLKRNNKRSTIQINKQRRDDYLELLEKYEELSWRYDFLISKYFSEVKSQLNREDLFLQFADNYTTQQYIELLNDRIKQYNKEKDNAVWKYNNIHQLLQSSTPFKSSAELIARIESAMYDYISGELRYKQNPAITTADRIEKEFKQEYIKWRVLYEELYAKYQFLCETFPDLKLYIDDEESLVQLEDITSINDLTDDTDRTADYLTKEEWMRLTPIERNQLALDRYIKKGRKSNAIIGFEYEMYVDYMLRTKGFSTTPHGILEGVNDLGRDILAERDYDGITETYIIQCKLRSHDKVIHENVICQLFGTTLEYKFANKDKNVIPVICTNVPLSGTAKRFADIFHIFQLCTPMREYPRIKCNINSNGEKIYHLPFDQQYWRTQIKNDGECYAWTVREAEDMGFRRAMRYNPYTNQ